MFVKFLQAKTYKPGIRRVAYRCRSFLSGLLPTLVDGRDLAVELDCQTLSRANRSTDINRRTRLAGGGGRFAVPEEGLVARIGPEDLIALRVLARLSDRAGTNDLPLRHGLLEARERRILGASEADSAVALSVGARALARAGVDRTASLR